MMACRCRADGVHQLRRIIHHIAQMPVGKAWIVFPVDAVRVQENAGARSGQEFVNLAADVAHINVRRRRVAGIDRAIGTGIDQNVRAAASTPTGAQFLAAPAEQLHMRGDEQVERWVLRKPRQHRFDEAMP